MQLLIAPMLSMAGMIAGPIPDHTLGTSVPFEHSLLELGLTKPYSVFLADYAHLSLAFRVRMTRYSRSGINATPDTYFDGVIVVSPQEDGINVEEVGYAKDAELDALGPRRKLTYFSFSRGECAVLESTLGSGRESIILSCSAHWPTWIHRLYGLADLRLQYAIAGELTEDESGDAIRLRCYDARVGEADITVDSADRKLIREQTCPQGRRRETVKYLGYIEDQESGLRLPTQIVRTVWNDGNIAEIEAWQRVKTQESPDDTVQPGAEVLDLRCPNDTFRSMFTDRIMPIREALAWTPAPEGDSLAQRSLVISCSAHEVLIAPTAENSTQQDGENSGHYPMSTRWIISGAMITMAIVYLGARLRRKRFDRPKGGE